MAEKVLGAAVTRLERAIARLERRSPAPPAGGDPLLPERHERLRARVTQAIGQLDALIAAREADG